MDKNLVLLAVTGLILLGSTAYLFTHDAHKSEVNTKLSYPEEVIERWKLFKKTYHKKYSDPDLEAYRIQIFAENLEVVKKDKTGTFGVTQFFDLSQKEFASIYLTLKAENYTVAKNEKVRGGEINWVTQDAVTPVKDQGQCGSCWAFSATGALESAYIVNQKATSDTISVSEQQLVDCSSQNSGCNGGVMVYAFNYIKQSGGLASEQSYPYKAVTQTCDKSEITGTLYPISGIQQNVGTTTQKLLNALQTQPISIAVDASVWSYYTGGVIQGSACGTSLNHGVLLVGFENDTWIIKNSWGTSWGENGYIRLQNGNTCGLANSYASYPLL